MTGRGWRIACCIALLERGEEEATGEDAAAIANEVFGSSELPARVDEGEFELRQFWQHLRFLRDP
jgi:hypothetical protein